MTDMMMGRGAWRWICGIAVLAGVQAFAAPVHIDGGDLWQASAQEVQRARGTRAPTAARYQAVQLSDANYAEWAMQAAEALKDRLGVAVATDELRVRSVMDDVTGDVHVRLDQVYHGLPVRANQLVVHFRPDGTVYQVNGAFISGISISTEPAITQPEGGELLVWAPVGAEDGAEARLAWRTGAGGVWTFTDAQTGETLGEERRARRGARRTRAPAKASSGDDEEWLADYFSKYAPQARTNAFPKGVACTIRGQLPHPLWTNGTPCVVKVPGIRGDDGYFYLCGTNRHGRAFSIWNAEGVANAYLTVEGRVAELPTAADANGVARYVSDDWGDYNPEAIGAAYHVMQVMDYFQEEFGRETYLGAADARTCAFVCLPEKNSSGKVVGGYDNAFFYADVEKGGKEPAGSGAMYFGYKIGGERSFQVLDVTGHEFSHAIAENTASFVYEGESGALDESFADIFGAGCEAFTQPAGPEYPGYEPQTAEWFMGEDIGEARPLRDLVNPASGYVEYKQAAAYRDSHWADTYLSIIDSGGVHGNSGIQNKFFHLLQGEIGVAAALQIAYLTVTAYCAPGTGFKQVSQLWADAAAQLAGKTLNGVAIPADARAAVERSWSGLTGKPAFTAGKSCTFVGYMEDVDLFVKVYAEKAANGKSSVKFTIDDGYGWTESSYGTLNVSTGKVTIRSILGKVTLDFAADNVIGSWTVSDALTGGHPFTTQFTAFCRAPKFIPSAGESELLGRYIGVKVSEDMYSYMDYTAGDGLQFSAKGLPAGVSIDKYTGVVSGVPKKIQKGTATVMVKSWLTGMSATCRLNYDIKALPGWACRKYAAYAYKASATKASGSINASVTSAGKLSGYMKIGTKKWKFSAKSYGGCSDAGDRFTVSMTVKNGANKGKVTFGITPEGMDGSATLAGVKYLFQGGWDIGLALAAEPLPNTDVYLIPAGKKTSIGLQVTADAPYTLTAKDLPAGLKLVKNGAAYSISGTATKPGELPGKVKINVRTYSVPAGRTFYFRFLVDNFHTDQIPTEEHYDAMKAGFPSEFFIEGATNCVVKGLPPGLKFDAATGRIYGVATGSGDYLVSFTRTIGKGKGAKVHKATALFRVEALPATVRGSFSGLATMGATDDSNGATGTATLSVPASGKASGKYMWADGSSHGFAMAQFSIDGDGCYAVTGGVTKVGRRTFSTDVTFGETTFPAADGGNVARGVAALDTALISSPYEEDAEAVGAGGWFGATLLQSIWNVPGAKVPKFAFTKKVKRFVKKANVGAYELKLAFCDRGKVTVTVAKRGKTKTLASISTEIMVTDYVPGEGWMGEVAVVLPKLKVYRVFQVKIADVASVTAGAIMVME